jgi:hypothetical protein
MNAIHLIYSLLVVLPLTASALDTDAIEKVTGLEGSFNEEERVFKLTWPRGDLGIEVDGWKMSPFMGLTTWAAFAEGKEKEAMVMGDLVLLQDEVNPVMSVLLDSGLAVTALHNHFFHDEPKVYFMHISGEGNADQLAKSVRAGLDKVKEIRAASPRPARSFGNGMPQESAVTAAPLAEVVGEKPQEKDGRSLWIAVARWEKKRASIRGRPSAERMKTRPSPVISRCGRMSCNPC